MGIVRVQYENTLNRNIQFDVDAFDYIYDSETLDTDAQSDFESSLFEIGDAGTLIKQTSTVDGQGVVSAVSETSYIIITYFTDITKRDLQLLGLGEAVLGSRMAYVLPEYTSTSAGVETTWEVEENDIIQDNASQKWRVMQVVQEPFINDTKVYKKLLVRQIGLQGTE